MSLKKGYYKMGDDIMNSSDVMQKGSVKVMSAELVEEEQMDATPMGRAALRMKQKTGQGPMADVYEEMKEDMDEKAMVKQVKKKK